MSTLKEKLTNPLKSRKVLVAIATVLVAFLAEWGIDVSEALVVGILGVGVSVIWGIAKEDAAMKAAGTHVPTLSEATHEGVSIAMETTNKAIEDLTKTIRAKLERDSAKDN